MGIDCHSFVTNSCPVIRRLVVRIPPPGINIPLSIRLSTSATIMIFPPKMKLPTLKKRDIFIISTSTILYGL